MKPSDLKGYGCGGLFLTPFFLVGCVTAFLMGKHLVTSLEMQAWPVASATVLRVDLNRESDGESSSWKISAEYEYVYEEAKYRGTRVGLDDSVGWGGNLKKRARLLGEAQQAGRPVPCYVNPRSPAESVLFPAIQWEQVFLLSIFGFVFGGFGAGGYAFLWHAGRTERERQRLKSEYPEQPWAWRAAWNRGTIPAGSKTTMIGLWAFASIWNAISAPIPFMLVDEWAQGNKLILVAILFPLVGAGLAIAALRATLLWLKYGRTEFVMRSVPGVIGGDLVGAIRIPRPVEFQDRVKLTLSCLKKTTSGSGNNESTSETVLWQSEHAVGGDDVQIGQQTLVLVVFTIPYACQPTDEASGIQWRLEASAPTPGLDFQVQFEVPVFKTADSRQDVTEQSIVDPAAQAEQLKEAARASRVYVHQRADGSLELDVPPAAFRSTGQFLALAAFTAIWTAGIFFADYVGAPLLLLVVFGLFDLLLGLILLGQLTGRKRSHITTDAVETSSRLLWFWSHRSIPAEQVHRVEFPITSRGQQGSRHYAWYSVRVFYRDAERERHVDVADMIGNKAEAQWIAAAIEDAILRE